jgi:hypothetical protein
MSNYESEGRFSENIYAYEVGLRSVEQQAHVSGGIKRLVDQRGRALASEEMDQFEVMSILSLQVERKDPESQFCSDPDMLASKALLRGAMTGLLVAEAAYDGIITTKEILSSLDVKGEIKSGSDDDRRGVNEALAEIGNTAFEQMESMQDVITQWESVCVDSVPHQYYYRIGLGLVMGSANKAVNGKYLDYLHQEMEQAKEYDWDQGLSDLLDTDK